MRTTANIKEIRGFKYYTGNHPAIKALNRSGKRPTEFGNKVWASSLVLIDHLQEEPIELQGLRVLEIGCGWGLLGGYLAKQFSCQVTCTDFDENVLPIVQLHAELNTVSLNTICTSFQEISIPFLRNFDLIIGAEVCYSEEVAKQISELIKRAEAASVQHILIADPGRPDFDDCVDLGKKHYDGQLVELPGSVNGKTTQLLSLHHRET